MGAMKGIENGLKANVNDMFSHAKAIVHDNIYALNHKHYSGVMWVACLDWKTCHVCSQLDGKIFGYHMELFPSSDGKGGIHEGPPKIPKHFNCRCITVPILKGMEDDYTGSPNYREWFERQPKKVQLDILGPSRYALFKNGLPVERFVKDGRVLTLEELIEREGLRFIGAGIYKKSSRIKDLFAKKYYQSIRNRKVPTDIKKIADATGFSIEEIRQIRGHLFTEVHNLHGEKRGMFEPDWLIAQAWQRMEQAWRGHGMDRFKKYDILLLRHEQMESTLMRTKGINALEAHRLTVPLFPWYVEIMGFIERVLR